MFRVTLLLLLLGFALPAWAEEEKVSIRFLGGAKRVPLDELTVTIRKHTGDWTEDQKRTQTNGKTGKNGDVVFKLAEGLYYVELAAKRELPYLNIPVGYKEYPPYYDRIIKVGKERAFEFNLADACKLTLRAVDATTGVGIAGVSFEMLSPTAEWGGPVIGDNLGADHKKQAAESTNMEGYLIRYMGPWDGYTYFACPTPEGYEPAPEVTIPTPLFTERAEHVFKFRKK